MVCLFGIFPGSWGNIPLANWTTWDAQIKAGSISCLLIIFSNKKKITFPRGLFRTVFTVHTYLLFTSDFNELLNNTVCWNGTVRMQQPRKVRVGVYLYKRDSDCFTQSVDIYLSNRASRFEPSSPNCYRIWISIWNGPGSSKENLEETRTCKPLNWEIIFVSNDDYFALPRKKSWRHWHIEQRKWNPQWKD